MVLSTLRLKVIDCENMNGGYILLAKVVAMLATWVPRQLTIGIDRAGMVCSLEGESCIVYRYITVVSRSRG